VKLTDVLVPFALVTVLGYALARFWMLFWGPCSGTLAQIPGWCLLFAGSR
jgi:hypothetical protein